MTDSGAAARRRDVRSIPQGEVLGSYESYERAQQIVDQLAKADFPVAALAILGNDLKTVERVTRKLSWSRAAIEGALSGAWFGLFLGLLFSFSTTTPNLNLGLAAILIGAGFGMLFRIVSYGLARRRRDFESTSQVLASSYDVIVDPGSAGEARRILGI